MPFHGNTNSGSESCICREMGNDEVPLAGGLRRTLRLGGLNRNMEWMVTTSSAPLLLFLPARCLHIPVEEELGSNEAVTEGRDHKGASHEGISRFLNVRNS